jgi:cell division protease FtsH
MVLRFGMGGEDLGEVAHGPDRQGFLGTPEFRPRAYAEATAARIDSAVRALIAEASARAEAILARNRALL